MTHGGLFDGIGGFNEGFRWAGIETVWMSEIDPFCRKILKHHYPNAKLYGDIRNIGKHNLEPVDIISGGFPCQPFSRAGKRRGKNDDRYLWDEMLRVIDEMRPRWCIGENVDELASMVQPTGKVIMENETVVSYPMGADFSADCIITERTLREEMLFILEPIMQDLEGLGYETVPITIPACGVGAWHKRNRLWIVAYAQGERDRYVRKGERDKRYELHSEGRSRMGDEPYNICEDDVSDSDGERQSQSQGIVEEQRGWFGDGCENVSDSRDDRNVERERKCPKGEQISGSGDFNGGGEEVVPFREWWAAEPDVGRVVDGVSNRLAKLRGLGNAVVPQIPYLIGKRIMEIEKNGNTKITLNSKE